MFLIDVVLTIAYYIIHIYAICLVIAAILSFVGANQTNPIVGFFTAITQPPCRALSRKFPKLIMRAGHGYLDLSPIVLLLALGCLMIVIEKLAYYLGIYL